MGRSITLVVATDLDGVIGRDGGLPWRLPADLKRFRRVTMGKPIVMGRKTHESIGKPLDGRKNIVLTRREDYAPEGCEVARTPEEALALAGDAEDVMIIGGAEIYELFLPRADRILLTVIRDHFEGDTHLPELVEGAWREVERLDQPADEKNPHAHSFLELHRI